jgi:hypothetical protein
VPRNTYNHTRGQKRSNSAAETPQHAKNMQSQALLVALSLSANALQLSRRDLAKALAPVGVALVPVAAQAADIKACPKGANNCWSTASTDKTSLKPWTFPDKKTAAKELRAALEAYPQGGQNKVDEGGWSFAVDELDKSGYARLEYKSGLGNMAKYFNGGKPFVDDLEVLVGGDSVSVRSWSVWKSTSASGATPSSSVASMASRTTQ